MKKNKKCISIWDSEKGEYNKYKNDILIDLGDNWEYTMI